MDLFELVASLGIDTSGFSSGLQDALNTALGWLKDFAEDVVETGMGFDKQMSAVQAVLGETEGTIENMNRLREYGLEIAEDSIFTAEQTADAYYYMGMAGWKTEQMIAGLPGVISLAAASGNDLAEVSDIVTDSLTAFGLGAGQATRFADVLAATATNTNTDVSRMGKTFQYLAPVAGSLGYSMEDVALAIGLVANQGIKGSMAGTSLRNIFTRLATDGGATSNSLGALGILTEELGVQFYDATGKARPLLDVISDARSAWRTLDPAKAQNYAAIFGEIADEGLDASEVLQDFTQGLDEWTTEWNSLTTDVERENFAAKWEGQFSVLGISLRDSNGKLREFNDVANEARIKLGGLNDEEKLFYAQKIGNLRGMTSWLALMNATDEEFAKVQASIEGASGAAEAMADIKLDNLWGDTIRFRSALDVLKIAIFDDVKGPMRDVVQYGTEALKRITDAVNENGLSGGIHQLSLEIIDFGNNFQDEIGELASSLVPIVNTVVDELAPAFTDAVVNLGGGFIEGIGKGLWKSLVGIFTGENKEFWNAVGTWGNLVWNRLDTVVSSFDPLGLNAMAQIEKIELPEDWQEQQAQWEAENPINATVIPLVDPDVLSAAVDEANATGDTTIEIDGFTWQTEHVQAIVDTLNGAGTDGGKGMAANVGTELGNAEPGMTSGLIDAISDAGDPAGANVSASIYNHLVSTPYHINVSANVTGLPGVRRNASAMATGRIFKRPTIFGYDGGSFQMAGDAGPEAVIGTNSLASLITNAVANGNRGREVVVPRNSTPQNLTVVMEFNKQEFGRMVYELNEQETQRVGVKLSGGGY